MKKENIKKISSDKLLLAEKKNYFLGEVILHNISKTIGVTDQKVYYAGFKNGARTKVHYHEGGQVLVVTKCKGTLVLYEASTAKDSVVKIKPSARSVLKVGDIVYIPKKTLHWHGALQKNNFVHIAFNAFTSKGKESKTFWYDSDFTSYATRIS
jgi:quercetin dioxygenase-like cupin family protein